MIVTILRFGNFTTAIRYDIYCDEITTATYFIDSGRNRRLVIHVEIASSEKGVYYLP